MNYIPFANRNFKEILRDPLSIIFGVGFPVVMMILMTQLQKNIVGMPADVFSVDAFAPGITVFGLAFLSLFLGVLMATDRESSFLHRLFSSPLKSKDYILGYAVSVIPIAIIQGIVCFSVAAFLGMEINGGLLLAVLVVIPIALLFISIGLLFGVSLNNKQIGGAGSILVNAVAFLSGVWFSLDMIGGTFKVICEILPFYHCVQALEGALSGDYLLLFQSLSIVLIYVVILYVGASLIFKKKMQN